VSRAPSTTTQARDLEWFIEYLHLHVWIQGKPAVNVVRGYSRDAAVRASRPQLLQGEEALRPQPLAPALRRCNPRSSIPPPPCSRSSARPSGWAGGTAGPDRNR